jgi:hypothetical protein
MKTQWKRNEETMQSLLCYLKFLLNFSDLFICDYTFAFIIIEVWLVQSL